MLWGARFAAPIGRLPACHHPYPAGTALRVHRARPAARIGYRFRGALRASRPAHEARPELAQVPSVVCGDQSSAPGGGQPSRSEWSATNWKRFTSASPRRNTGRLTQDVAFLLQLAHPTTQLRVLRLHRTGPRSLSRRPCPAAATTTALIVVGKSLTLFDLRPRPGQAGSRWPAGVALFIGCPRRQGVTLIWRAPAGHRSREWLKRGVPAQSSVALLGDRPLCTRGGDAARWVVW
jgi:hypothetical protein